MEYSEAIDAGFGLYDKVENELRVLSRQSNMYTDISYSEGFLKIKADYGERDIEAEINIGRDEIIQKVLDEDLEPKDVICKLIKEKICIAAHDVRR